MQTRIKFLLVLLLIINYRVEAQSTSEIVGRWLYQGSENNKKMMVECPDLLVLNKDSSYSILNDCYGDDIENPIVEQGKWSFDPQHRRIALKNRKYYVNYAFYNSNQVMFLYIKELNNKCLKICLSPKKGCIVEKYKKAN